MADNDEGLPDEVHELRTYAAEVRDHAWLSRFKDGNNSLSDLACQDIAGYIHKLLDKVDRGIGAMRAKLQALRSLEQELRLEAEELDETWKRHRNEMSTNGLSKLSAGAL